MIRDTEGTYRRPTWPVNPGQSAPGQPVNSGWSANGQPSSHQPSPGQPGSDTTQTRPQTPGFGHPPTQAPGYGPPQNYPSAPGYGQTPSTPSAPSYGQTPNNAPAPGYGQTPNNAPAPGYGQTPSNAPAPGYGQTPSNLSAPSYAPAPSYGQSPGSPSAPSYASVPSYPSAPSYGQSPGYSPGPGYSPQGQAAPGYAGPGGPGSFSPAGGYPAPGPAGKPAKNRALIIGLCVLLVAGLGTAGWLVLRPKSSPAFTFSGHRIANADAVLTAAQATTAKLVTSRHGASNSDTRCYFARPSKPASGTKKSDIDANAYCGPVLFVDGDKTQTYLSYPLSQGGTKSGATTLTASTTPRTPDPQAVPAGLTLARPDKVAPKSGVALAVPAPPPAPADFFTTAPDLAGQSIPAAPAAAVMGSRYGGVRLTHLGRLARYGHGDSARSAPTGQKLIAFQIAAAPSDSDSLAAFPDGTLTVGVAGHTHTVPRNTTPVLIAIPDSATTANLVLSDAGVTQTLSLLTGKPGAANLAVDRRTHHTVAGGAQQTIAFKESAPGASITRTAHVKLYASGLRYWVNLTAGDTRHASSPGTALLNVRLLYTFTGPPKSPFTSSGPLGPFAFDPKMLSLHLPDGRVIAARNYATNKDLVYIMFPVPASYTTGRVYVSGHATNVHNVTFSVPKPISFPVSVAKG